MQAIDTNILIYAEIESSKRHESALELLKRLAEGTLPWAIPWPCIYEFLRVVTHPVSFILRFLSKSSSKICSKCWLLLRWCCLRRRCGTLPCSTKLFAKPLQQAI